MVSERSDTCSARWLDTCQLSPPGLTRVNCLLPHTHTHYTHTHTTHSHSNTHEYTHTTHYTGYHQYHRIGLAMPSQGMLGMVVGPSKRARRLVRLGFGRAWRSRGLRGALQTDANRSKPALWAYQAVPNLAVAVDSVLIWVASVFSPGLRWVSRFGSGGSLLVHIRPCLGTAVAPSLGLIQCSD